MLHFRNGFKRWTVSNDCKDSCFARSAMEGGAEFPRGLFLDRLELTIEVGQVPVSDFIGDRGNGLLRIQQQGASVADSQLSHVFDDRGTGVELE